VTKTTAMTNFSPMMKLQITTAIAGKIKIIQLLNKSGGMHNKSEVIKYLKFVEAKVLNIFM
jgi:hypothetical protein